jgi:hypothetical protein
MAWFFANGGKEVVVSVAIAVPFWKPILLHFFSTPPGHLTSEHNCNRSGRPAYWLKQ